ncbi:OmpP1/FadL family transporter [Pseudorhodobacter sp.]|uniref:OmpP1/FadL family transporter n=1 Tax=Pseudorhodobacter sp. TaxID=1934400 RepID=UPI0039E34763
MKKIVTTLGAVALSASAAHAGGIDRSGQGLGNLFEKGRHIEFTFGRVNPKVSGNDVALFGGRPSGDVANNFNQLSFGYKYDVNDRLSFAMLVDQPFGADVAYGTTSVALGGTKAVAKSTALTGLLRYKLENGFSVHGGLSAQRASADVTLRGAAYAGLSGYNVALASDYGIGYVAGFAYEKPEIALRVALTYRSAIKHDFDTVEKIGAVQVSLPGAITNVKTPQSVNLDFQTGVAKDTLVFGQIRWVDWSNFKLAPTFFAGTPGNADGLVNLEDSITYTLGVGRKFTENWSGAFSVSYEKKGKPLVSPLGPTTGKLGATLAAVYTKDNMKITTGINYTKLGNAMPETGTPDVARANFTGNKAIGVGVKVGFSF